jgi:hypothetical protein
VQQILCRTAVAVSLLCVACGAREDAAPGEDGTQPPTADAAPPATPQEPPQVDDPAPPAARPQTRTDTIMVEGTAETSTSRLVTASGGFARPFSTYVPEGIEAAVNAPSTARFTAAFAGNLNSDAYMEVFVYPSGATRPRDEEILSRLMSARNAAEHETSGIDRPSWAMEATAFRYVGADGTNFTGSVMVGQHGGTWVHIVRHYPVEYGDGLPPRLNAILGHWRWEDTGEMLR